MEYRILFRIFCDHQKFVDAEILNKIMSLIFNFLKDTKIAFNYCITINNNPIFKYFILIIHTISGCISRSTSAAAIALYVLEFTQ